MEVLSTVWLVCPPAPHAQQGQTDHALAATQDTINWGQIATQYVPTDTTQTEPTAYCATILCA